MNKIKILYTIPNFDTAGSGKVLYDLAKGLDTNLFEVHIACHHKQGSFYKEIEKLGLKIHILPTVQPLRPYTTFISRITPFKKFVKINKFDIVHSWHWSSDWSEVVAVRFGGAKYVYTKKAMSWGNVHWKIKIFLSHFIITLNPEMRDFFSYKKYQQLIPLGLDMNVYSPDLFEIKESTGIFKIITVANLVAVKGIEVLIEAIKLLNKSEIRLEIIGDDTTEYSNQLKRMVSDYSMEKQIIFRGMQSDVRPYLVQSDLYVIPSYKEGMPMALVEAMAMSIPVLGSNISGINYVLCDFPDLLFEAGNSEQLSQAIQLWMTIPEAERKAKGAILRKYCQEHYALEQCIRAHEELYQQLYKK
jgi:glycosyltransferase involved in cell wall biosynthesis